MRVKVTFPITGGCKSLQNIKAHFVLHLHVTNDVTCSGTVLNVRHLVRMAVRA